VPTTEKNIWSSYLEEMMKEINFNRLIPVFLIVIGLFLLNVPRTASETTYVDSSSETIQKAIVEIEKTSKTDQDKIINTAEYVKKHVKYTVMGDRCFAQTASETIIGGEGDCVSMTKSVLAILTGMGIPAKAVEGCVLNADGRESIRPFTIPENPFVKLEVGRAAGPHGGQLHSWVRAYDGVRWWTVETTAGVAFSSKYETDYGYDDYGFVDISDGEHLCLMEDLEYANWCNSY
jgi:transglutaminase-like putative cysteine protease